jgi:Ser/Thr protein kinase RdoA (MazF antagonist)
MSDFVFQQRIGYKGDIKPVILQICKDFSLSEYISHKVILMGYEDFNLILTTDKGKYFIKMFATFRTEKESRSYVDTMVKVLEAGVNHPKLYQSQQGYFHKITADNTQISLCVMEFIDGVSFYEEKLKATLEEMRLLVQQAALINKIDLKPKFVHDSWAIVNFLDEYKNKKQYLDAADRELIEPLAQQFSILNLDELPHCFVHGDIIKTNVIKETNGKLYIIDFSVSSYYPRVQELAVLLCNLLFDEDNPETFNDNYKLALEEYQKYITLTKKEIEILPLYVRVAHVMHVICATYEKAANGNNSVENEYWINLGRIGLKYTTKAWNPDIASQ